MRKTKTNEVVNRIYQAADMLTTGESVAFLAQRVCRWKGELSAMKNRIRSAIHDAIHTGQLQDHGKGQFLFGEMVAWAKTKKWGQNGLEGLPVIVSATATPSGVASAMAVGLTVATDLPEDLDECRRALLAERQEKAVLIRELEAKEKEVQDLIPYKQHYDGWR